MFTKRGLAICAEARDKWEDVDNPKIYEKVKRADTLFSNPVYLMKDVVDYKAEVIIRDVKPAWYFMFVRHDLTPDSNFPGASIFIVSINLTSPPTEEKEAKMLKDETVKTIN